MHSCSHGGIKDNMIGGVASLSLCALRLCRLVISRWGSSVWRSRVLTLMRHVIAVAAVRRSSCVRGLPRTLPSANLFAAISATTSHSVAYLSPMTPLALGRLQPIWSFRLHWLQRRFVKVSILSATPTCYRPAGQEDGAEPTPQSVREVQDCQDDTFEASNII